MGKKKTHNWDFSRPITNLQKRIARAKLKWLSENYIKDLEKSISKCKAK